MADHHVQAKLTSKLVNLSLPEYQFSLPTNSGCGELNELVNKLVNEHNDSHETKSFDFLINGILLRVSLEEFLNDYGLSSEDVLTIECILKEEAPKPETSLPHDDWVGDLTLTSKYILSACYDCTLHIWSLKNRKHLLKVTGHTGAVKCLAVLPRKEDSKNGEKNSSSLLQFATGSQDQTVMLWSYSTTKNEVTCLQVGRGHERSVECLCSNSDGTRLASGSFDTYIKIWNTDPEKSDEQNEEAENSPKKFKTGDGNVSTLVKTPMVTLAGHREVVSGICWTPNEPAEIVTCSWDRTLTFWDLELAGQKSNFTSPAGSAFTCLSISSPTKNRGLVVTGSTDPYVRLWDPRNKAVTAAKSIFSSHNGWVIDVDWSKTNENLFISASYDKTLKMWDIRSLKASLYDLTGHEDRLLCCDWSNPGWLASGGADNSVKLFSMPQ